MIKKMVESNSIVKSNYEINKVFEYDSKYTVEFGYGFYKLIESISKMVDEIEININIDKIHINFMDPSRIFLCDVVIEDSLISELVVNQIGKYAVNVDDFAKVLKVNKSDQKSFTLKFDTTKIYVDKIKENGFKTTKTLMLIDLDMEEIPMDNLLKIEYPNAVKIQKEYLEDLFKELGTYSEIVEIGISKDGINFKESGQVGEGLYTIENEYLNELDIPIDDFRTYHEEKGAYSISYLALLKYLFAIMEKKQLVTMKIKTDHPIHISTEFEELGISFNTFTAPRIEESDFDDDDDFDDF